MKHNDLTFFTNEPERNLHNRFDSILSSNTQYFDVLVGYFRTSGFHLLYPSLEKVEKIRILVGLNVDSKTIQIIEQSKNEQLSLNLSSKQVKSSFKEDVIQEIKNSEDTHSVEQGIHTFIKWLQSGKLEMRIYPEASIHAKVYIMRKNPDKVPDQYGSVITGSSNFSKSGLLNNLEFNVELKDSRDVDFALERFEDLWVEGIDISSEYIDIIKENTWLNDEITPYQMYLKTLYEYFYEELNADLNTSWVEVLPDKYMRLQYQIDAVVQAKKTLDSYGGVFISDVVGLGKTYISAMLARQLHGKKLFICPPVLKEYWEKVLLEFNVAAKVESLGKLDQILESGIEKYEFVFIDEAHRFRNENTENFRKLHEICYNKKVILISATPQNNYSTDIGNQIYLFQPKHKSTIIPGNKNLEKFFLTLEGRLKKNKKGSEEYNLQLKENSEEIRNKVLRNIMIRRTRREIEEVYKDDLQRQGLSFPRLNQPMKIIYEFTNEIDKVFTDTISVIQRLDYTRYKPLTYLMEMDGQLASMMTSQKNMGGFMKSILVKRLESSFVAFKKTLRRFIVSYEKFIGMAMKGKVYIGKKVDIYDLLDNGDDERLMDMVEEDQIQSYSIDKFNENFLISLNRDLILLKKLEKSWEEVKNDPKKDQFLNELEKNSFLKNNKIIIFTESKETADYIANYLEEEHPGKVISFSGQGTTHIRKVIEANYNPTFEGNQKDDIKFLVTTDVLAEGINLHRSNVIINYDLPWNPTKVMQRVGRINRVGTQHKEIYVFNFFPTAQASKHLTLEENIISKIQSFHDTLGEDFKYLSIEEDVNSHKLYKILNSENIYENENQEGVSDQIYLKYLREIRDSQPELFARIKKIPGKARTGKLVKNMNSNVTVSFLRKGSLKKFFLSDGVTTLERTFSQAIKLIECEEMTERVKPEIEYYEHLQSNKKYFNQSFLIEDEIIIEKYKKTGNDKTIIKYLKAMSSLQIYNLEQKNNIKKLLKLWEDGNIPASVSKEVIVKTKGLSNPQQIYSLIESTVPKSYLKVDREVNPSINVDGVTEVILSAYLKGK
ncbi:superfamily II DNA/RNA helicase [Exiguobacterium sp. PvP048]|uniref:helicase-related protein n=1 Tax=unclassified Exiguobacterium TaxID=2644629 RepID=UPI0033911B74